MALTFPAAYNSSNVIGGDTMQLLGQQFPLTHIPLHDFPPPQAFCGSFMVQLISMENLCVASASFLKEIAAI